MLGLSRYVTCTIGAFEGWSHRCHSMLSFMKTCSTHVDELRKQSNTEEGYCKYLVDFTNGQWSKVIKNMCQKWVVGSDSPCYQFSTMQVLTEYNTKLRLSPEIISLVVVSHFSNHSKTILTKILTVLTVHSNVNLWFPEKWPIVLFQTVRSKKLQKPQCLKVVVDGWASDCDTGDTSSYPVCSQQSALVSFCHDHNLTLNLSM